MSVGDSMRRFLETLSELDDHREVRSVVRDVDGEVRSEWRAKSLADEPFLRLHDGPTETESAEDAHLLEPTDEPSPGRAGPEPPEPDRADSDGDGEEADS